MRCEAFSVRYRNALTQQHINIAMAGIALKRLPAAHEALDSAMTQPSQKGRAMQPPVDESIEKAMYILGQIGAIVCHERGPRPNTAILATMASHPAEGLRLAATRMNELCPAVRGPRRTLLQWKRKEIARLARMLPHPLPADACAQ